MSTFVTKPQSILLFSGKRKSGKDFITEKLLERIGKEKSVIIRISAPIKRHWATKLGLNLDELLGTGEYKERFRKEMIDWSEEVRAGDYGFFCHSAVDMFKANEKLIWIVSDTRRKTDLKWFRENYGSVVKTVRVLASDSVRLQRGFKFTAGVDDVASECDLDSVVDWDLQITNDNSNPMELNNNLQVIISLTGVEI